MAKLSNDAYGKSFKRFQAETMIKVSEFKWVPQKDGYAQAKRLLSPAVRFALSDVWKGPPMTTQRRRVDLTAEQKEHMKKLKNELQMIVESGQAITAMNESAARQKLIQLSLGAVYDGDHFAHLVDASPRYKELEEIIESTERKVVIFVPITSVVHIVVKYLRAVWKKAELPYTCDFINGEVRQAGASARRSFRLTSTSRNSRLSSSTPASPPPGNQRVRGSGYLRLVRRHRQGRAVGAGQCPPAAPGAEIPDQLLPDRIQQAGRRDIRPAGKQYLDAGHNA